METTNLNVTQVLGTGTVEANKLSGEEMMQIISGVSKRLELDHHLRFMMGVLPLEMHLNRKIGGNKEVRTDLAAVTLKGEFTLKMRMTRLLRISNGTAAREQQETLMAMNYRERQIFMTEADTWAFGDLEFHYTNSGDPGELVEIQRIERATFGDLKRGELVEILDRNAALGRAMLVELASILHQTAAQEADRLKKTHLRIQKLNDVLGRLK